LKPRHQFQAACTVPEPPHEIYLIVISPQQALETVATVIK
jgi:hypothetical protein